MSRFYAELFLALGAEAFQMFPAGMSAQREDFGRALVQWVVADDPDSLTQHLEQLGDDHRKFGVEPRHYDLAGTALVSAWRQLAGDRWTDRIDSAVVGSYTRLASIMIDAALERRGEPATWGGTVVAHERPQRNLAMLRIQPDRPYPFLPGQYLTVELASRPREWRRMSIAAAPRADNTVELQVRAVNATGVAAALVMHTAVGDRVRLGPPRGGVLVVEPRTVSPGGLLCVASGTGTAPISAVVESMLEDPDCPPIYVFVGARMAADLYPAERLASIVHEAGRSDRVQLYGVVSHDPSWTGLRGRVEDVVPTLKDWGQLNVDALVAGSDSMISTTVFGLVGSGVPERSHPLRPVRDRRLRPPVCRNIRTLHNFEPPADDEEIRAAALQYVRKVSGSPRPSAANRAAFDAAVDEVAAATARLLDGLVTACAAEGPRGRGGQGPRPLRRAVRPGVSPARERHPGATREPPRPSAATRSGSTGCSAHPRASRPRSGRGCCSRCSPRPERRTSARRWSRSWASQLAEAAATARRLLDGAPPGRPGAPGPVATGGRGHRGSARAAARARRPSPTPGRFPRRRRPTRGRGNTPGA